MSLCVYGSRYNLFHVLFFLFMNLCSFSWECTIYVLMWYLGGQDDQKPFNEAVILVEIVTEWGIVFNLLSLTMLQHPVINHWKAALNSGEDSTGTHICTLFSASHSELQGETKILKLKNLRPKDYANYSCIASVRNVCGIPDRRVFFRLTNKTGRTLNTSYRIKSYDERHDHCT